MFIVYNLNVNQNHSCFSPSISYLLNRGDGLSVPMSDERRMRELELRDSARTLSQDNCPAQQKARFTLKG